MNIVKGARNYIGQQSEPARVSRFIVNEAMIRQWIEALDDHNPAYSDGDAIVSPPAMISTWVMQGYAKQREVRRLRARGEAADTALSHLMRELDEAGYTSVVATNIEQRFLSPVHLGVRVRCEQVIDAVSEVKHTALGQGVFVTLRKSYRDDDSGEELAQESFRMLRFAPAPQPTARPTAVPQLVRTEDNAFWFEGAQSHRLLFQRCDDCRTLRHPPGPSCPACHSLAWSPEESTREGSLHSWTIVHHPQDSAFTYPLAIGLVDLPNGMRIVADFDAVPDRLDVGMPVRIDFATHAHDEILPILRVVGTTPPVDELHEQHSIPELAAQPHGSVELPELVLDLDHTAIVAGALASQDYEDVHHNTLAARDRGLPDIILSINTTNGYVHRFVTDWAGPAARILEVKLTLGVPHSAGEALRFTGIATPDGENWSVDVLGRNDAGVHVRATVTLAIPASQKEQS